MVQFISVEEEMILSWYMETCLAARMRRTVLDELESTVEDDSWVKLSL